MEYLYRDGERQGCKCRTHGHLRKSISDITSVLRMWRGREKGPVRAVAFLRVRRRTGQGYQCRQEHPALGTQSSFGRDAANAGNCVEAPELCSGCTFTSKYQVPRNFCLLCLSEGDAIRANRVGIAWADTLRECLMDLRLRTNVEKQSRQCCPILIN